MKSVRADVKRVEQAESALDKAGRLTRGKAKTQLDQVVGELGRKYHDAGPPPVGVLAYTWHTWEAKAVKDAERAVWGDLRPGLAKAKEQSAVQAATFDQASREATALRDTFMPEKRLKTQRQYDNMLKPEPEPERWQNPDPAQIVKDAAAHAEAIARKHAILTTRIEQAKTQLDSYQATLDGIPDRVATARQGLADLEQESRIRGAQTPEQREEENRIRADQITRTPRRQGPRTLPQAEIDRQRAIRQQQERDYYQQNNDRGHGIGY